MNVSKIITRVKVFTISLNLEIIVYIKNWFYLYERSLYMMSLNNYENAIVWTKRMIRFVIVITLLVVKIVLFSLQNLSQNLLK